MAKVKYRIREFKPTANQTGGHSVYAGAKAELAFAKAIGLKVLKITNEGQIKE